MSAAGADGATARKAFESLRGFDQVIVFEITIG
jgi:hypothetical protein